MDVSESTVTSVRHPVRGYDSALRGKTCKEVGIRILPMASVQKRHFVVDAGFDPNVDKSELQVKLESTHNLNVAALLEANAMAEHDIDWELRYRSCNMSCA